MKFLDLVDPKFHFIWEHKTETPKPESESDYHDASFILQAIALTTCAVLLFRYHGNQLNHTRTHDVKAALQHRIESLNSASRWYTYMVPLFITKTYMFLPYMVSMLDTKSMQDIFDNIFSQRDDVLDWFTVNNLDVTHTILKIFGLWVVLENNFHLFLKVKFTKIAQRHYGETYHNMAQRRDEFTQIVAFWVDFVKLVLVFCTVWSVCWSVKNTFLGLVSCGFFMVFYYEILTIFNGFNALQKGFNVTGFASLVKVVQQVLDTKKVNDKRHTEAVGRNTC